MNVVTTHLLKRDIAFAIMARLTRPAALFKAWALWTIIVAALMLTARGLPQDALDVMIRLISATAGAIISVAIALCFSVMRAVSNVKTGDGILGEHRYEVRADGLYEKTPVNETLAAWSGIKGVTEAGGFAFIELRSGTFHIIPRHAFHDDDQRQRFLAEIRQRVGPDRPNPPKLP